MLNLIHEELYKLFHKKGTYFGLAAIFIVQIAIAILAKKAPTFMSPEGALSVSFLGESIALFVMIAAAASIIAMEFQYGTIRQLLYRKYYRSQVFISKLIVIVLHAVVLYVLQFGMSLLLKVILFPKVDLGKQVGHGRTLLENLTLSTLGQFVGVLLLLSIVVLLATMLKNNAVAITVGYIGYFVIELAASFLLILITKWDWVKWNPFTMLLFGNQLTEPAMHVMTKLTTMQLGFGSALYTVAFTFIAYALFRRRNV
ncbi:ABC transporter permease [Lacticaseibacillus pabuli]|uniref:ABC transporter permease n=1 Tax=Lacticaseibacillus pabuli TaxID=3025672 RepID=A0ABY7WXI1_9LACO|nr:ABC transporter permease [Lacticaseibacillus sp. KACC 23028]WDF82645.1 ABC transporter permease [Lacticaseibacillus sp. KACC 23028]